MPNITEYRSPIRGLQPQEVGAEAYAQAGRRVGLFYNQMGADLGRTVSSLGQEYQKHLDFQEQLQNGPKLAQLAVQLNNAINQVGRQQATQTQQSMLPPPVPPHMYQPAPANAEPAPTFSDVDAGGPTM